HERDSLNQQLEEARALVTGRIADLEQDKALLIQTRTRLEGEIASLTSQSRRGKRSCQSGTRTTQPRAWGTESTPHTRRSGQGAIHGQYVARASNADERHHR